MFHLDPPPVPLHLHPGLQEALNADGAVVGVARRIRRELLTLRLRRLRGDGG